MYTWCAIRTTGTIFSFPLPLGRPLGISVIACIINEKKIPPQGFESILDKI